MSHKILIIIFFLVTQNFIYGQNKIGEIPTHSFHAIGIASGINQEKEENLLPLIHSGFVLNLSYEYRHIEKNYENVQFIVGLSRIKSDPEDITKSVNLLLNSSYSYCFNFLDKSDFLFFLGPRVAAAYSLSFFPNWDESHVYWSNYFSIGTTALAQYDLGDNQKFQFSLSVPLLSYYSRPDLLRLYKNDEISFSGFLKNSHSNMKVGFWDSVFALHLTFEYQFPVFRTKIEAISYSFDYTRIKRDDGNPFQQIIHQIGLRVLL